MSTECSTYLFYATLSDPDAGDTLYYRIFVDYSRDAGKLFTDVNEISPDTAHADGTTITFTVKSGDPRFADGNLTYTEPHMVELFVADRPFFDGPEPPARKTEEGGLVTSFVWPVQLATTADPRPCAGGTP